MYRFVDPRNDVAFKKIFGSEQTRNILISFLNAVLDLQGDHEIADLEILNPYQAPKVEILQYTLLDVRARDRRGVTFIVEMQVEQVEAFAKRFLYYAAKAYVTQIERGDEYPRLNQVIFIGILDFRAFAGADYLTRHRIINQHTQQQELRDLEFNFIELPKFTKDEHTLGTILEKWLYFIKHARDLTIIPVSADFAALRQAYEVANQFSWTREELDLYDYWSVKAQDERGAIQAALQRGRDEGQQIEREQLARRMLADGIDIATIARYTGLSADDLARLQ